MRLDRRFLLASAGAFTACAAGTAVLRGPAGLITPAQAQEVDLEALHAPGPLGPIAEGNPDAPVTIVEYASLTCPHCAAFHVETYPQIKEKYIDSGQARLIFREFPFEDVALAAFMLVRCAPDGRQWAMIDVLFRQQEVWAARDANPRDELFKIARLAGFTEQSFNECLKNEEVARGILAHREKGAEFGVRSTPTFFINGRVLRGNQPLEEFEALIAEALGE